MIVPIPYYQFRNFAAIFILFSLDIQVFLKILMKIHLNNILSRITSMYSISILRRVLLQNVDTDNVNVTGRVCYLT